MQERQHRGKRHPERCGGAQIDEAGSRAGAGQLQLAMAALHEQRQQPAQAATPPQPGPLGDGGAQADSLMKLAARQNVHRLVKSKSAPLEIGAKPFQGMTTGCTGSAPAPVMANAFKAPT